ncbi:MAG: hypothetical protein FWF10_03715 [Clostridiales bacterium]|nr:hypothetical protein [Clostridiales bacterium]
MRKLFCIFLIFTFLCLPAAARAEGGVDAFETLPQTATAKAVLLTPAQADLVIAESASDKSLAVAGLAKLPAILTLALAFDEGLIKGDTAMQVSKKAAEVSGPTAFLESGERMPAGDLMKAAIMISAGDAIWTLGENAFGSEQVFLKNIEATMQKLGLSLTLTDCVGTGTAFTAQELAAIARAAAKSPTFLGYAIKYMDTLHHSDGRSTELVNANRMIRNYSGCRGLLTGSSRDDGYSGVFYAERGGVGYVAVVIGCKNSEERFAAATSLFDYAYANCKLQTLAQEGAPTLTAYPVQDGDVRELDLYPHESVVSLLRKSDGELQVTYDLPEVLSAPLFADVPVGHVYYGYANESEPRFAIALYPAHDVLAFGFWHLILRLFRSYTGS